MSAALQMRDGDRVALDLHNWYAQATEGERKLLATLTGPVLDLGCGPGRLVRALLELGTPALGVDASPEAIRHAEQIGGSVILRSLFDRLPREGYWPTILLFDGNIGIGGNPRALLHRIAELLRVGGAAIVEVGKPGSANIEGEACVDNDGDQSEWFPWALVDVDSFDTHLVGSGLELTDWHVFDDRWFAVLTKSRRCNVHE